MNYSFSSVQPKAAILHVASTLYAKSSMHLTCLLLVLIVQSPCYHSKSYHCSNHLHVQSPIRFLVECQFLHGYVPVHDATLNKIRAMLASAVSAFFSASDIFALKVALEAKDPLVLVVLVY